MGVGAIAPREGRAGAIAACEVGTCQTALNQRLSREGHTGKVLPGKINAAQIDELEERERKKNGTLPDHAAVLETIVTTDLAKPVARKYGAELIEVLTGFKYIGEQIHRFELEGGRSFVFGLEESYGCLAGTYARDKDACVAVMMLCELAAFYKSKGMSLVDAMLSLYEEYGFYKEGMTYLTREGKDGAEQIRGMMTRIRTEPPRMLAGYRVLALRDYKAGTRTDLLTGLSEPTGLPSSNVLYFELEDDAWCCVRPSGTEPKIKFYCGVKGLSDDDADRKMETLMTYLTKMQ